MYLLVTPESMRGPSTEARGLGVVGTSKGEGRRGGRRAESPPANPDFQGGRGSREMVGIGWPVVPLCPGLPRSPSGSCKVRRLFALSRTHVLDQGSRTCKITEVGLPPINGLCPPSFPVYPHPTGPARGQGGPWVQNGRDITNTTVKIYISF